MVAKGAGLTVVVSVPKALRKLIESLEESIKTMVEAGME